ncbi:MAG: hypothetical protein A3E85_02815 [Gammaproteobacteria bacterium RIFCSPHIGHO2_12_FULL_45_12]|nr:MAG: hypothetical protein A3E85_02815 [Gammaproteobacteria bacterium RIFCSPHIGHO2_12_FULL_45_12]
MNTALLLIECQNDYFPNGRTPLEKSLEASARMEAVLHACREKKIPVVHVQHISTHPDAAYLLPCTKGAEFHSSITPIKGEMIIKKHSPNSFKDTQLLNYLIKSQVSHLVICGMTTQSAIDSTVRAAHDLGFNCTVIQDACVAKQLEFNHTPIPAQTVQNAFLAALQPSYANVISSEDFLHKAGARSVEHA